LVKGKTAYLLKGENPRFLVTNLDEELFPVKELYEENYCACGEMEDRIKEQQLHLFADRTSCIVVKTNQLRLYYSSVSYIIMNKLRKRDLSDTALSAS
jgi:hypothetical protein